MNFDDVPIDFQIGCSFSTGQDSCFVRVMGADWWPAFLGLLGNPDGDFLLYVV